MDDQLEQKIKEIIAKGNKEVEKVVKENKIKELAIETKKEENIINKIDLPFNKKKKFGILNKKTLQTKQLDKKDKPKEPVAFILKGNNEVDIIENVRDGLIWINRKTAKMEKRVPIIVPKSKQHSFPWGNEVIQGYIISEAEGVALPQDPLHDSLEQERLIKSIRQNYKEIDAKSKMALGIGQMVMYALLGLAAVVGVAAIFGTDVLSALGV